ncbi:MAG: hypothetical protein A3A94_00715 [Candidatus Portnoybacteria bacterium RIFCSPLOWO2_01_FULL_43_11]|uniref:DUF8128 domain-containing protein n=4 Tax=Candidatus Portnoyibacteriota TaxID=1817913 RepID=A0A1G2FCR4_9BACT|nr:MAG: hypothetical protein A2815_01550 [Candidatus Portnoybacteria bacterium RIFCSPHIGHO2_01_FULL_40_12b]OGZ36670.1 MAG: hypothetical protein A3D38_00180 [Candidatus Portnoybacteria bacterium RIFCSPHIGHO2_02_FULL_40_23]OGZ38553.1 MAG: hypothetical protein A3A94_00715 [Candidatus Portnoybacteria bacterium RIFCSPLOWO2_01_FULL_43_11]OGZ38899.1 MAG: hypothetical protein A3E90_02415 [Candidatus Portnoybacteria bacterium RIFCSPHIGHO2_12_FULL_40_11]OGZ40948.1 MAG: hypothetical protein A3I20_02915 [C
MLESLEIIISFLRIFLSFWWIWLPTLLFLLVKDLWLRTTRLKFIQAMKWVLLEIKPPREMKRDPRTMEQVFAGLHGFHRTIILKERLFLGHVQEWFSFEIAGLGGETHFFVRTLEQFRNQIEALIYAQYPEAEIFEIDDYTQFVPFDIPNKDYDLWATELILAKDDAYPIKTYPSFREGTVLLEEMIDPIASLAEVMSKLRKGEQIWVQTLVRPITEPKWEAKSEKIKNQLIGRKEERKQGVIGGEISGFSEASREKFGQLITGKLSEAKKDEKPPKPALITLLSQVEKDTITAIEHKAAKVYFETVIRFIYLGQKEVFNKANVSAFFGCFKQFNSKTLNSFKPNPKVTTRINYEILLKRPREFFRKKKIFSAYKRRYIPLHSPVMKHLKPLFFERLPILNRFFIKNYRSFVLNIEELATIYHLPMEIVKAPMLSRIEAKKGEPPMGLPVQ